MAGGRDRQGFYPQATIPVLLSLFLLSQIAQTGLTQTCYVAKAGLEFFFSYLPCPSIGLSAGARYNLAPSPDVIFQFCFKSF